MGTIYPQKQKPSHFVSIDEPIHNQIESNSYSKSLQPSQQTQRTKDEKLAAQQQQQQQNLTIKRLLNTIKGTIDYSFAKIVSKHIKLTPAAEQTLKYIKSAPGPAGKQRIPDMKSEIYYVFNKKATFQGNFKNKLPHGQALIHFPDGSLFYGQISQSDALGQGIYIYPDGSIYEGGFKDAKFSGYGCLCYRENKVKYMGTFEKGKPHGKGGQLYEDGSCYDGQYFHGVRQGQGVYVWENGDWYQGQFKDGLFEGWGKIYKNEQIYFEGKFKSGVKTGFGIIYKFGMKCVGNFNNDELEGLGTIFWENGIIYEANFKRSKLEGKGYIYFTDNSRCTAQWSNNELISKEQAENFGDAQYYIQNMKKRLNKPVQFRL